MDYILQPPTDKDDAKASQESKMLIFCIDISGSMCVSTGKRHWNETTCYLFYPLRMPCFWSLSFFFSTQKLLENMNSRERILLNVLRHWTLSGLISLYFLFWVHHCCGFVCLPCVSPETRWAPRERHDVTYVSRLQSVQAAVDAQLEQMEREQPNRRVGVGESSHFLVVKRERENLLTFKLQ